MLTCKQGPSNRTKTLTLCLLCNLVAFLSSAWGFFQNRRLRKILSGISPDQSVKQFWSRSGLTFCQNNKDDVVKGGTWAINNFCGTWKQVVHKSWKTDHIWLLAYIVWAYFRDKLFLHFLKPLILITRRFLSQCCKLNFSTLRGCIKMGVLCALFMLYARGGGCTAPTSEPKIIEGNSTWIFQFSYPHAAFVRSGTYKTYICTEPLSERLSLRLDRYIETLNSATRTLFSI